MERAVIRNRLSQYFDVENRIFTQERFNVEECIPGQASWVLRHAFRPATPEEAVKILREHGLKAKIFAIHSSRTQSFEVKSREFDWEVMPLKKSGERVPSEILEGISMLENRGIEIQKLYIAKPKQYALADLLKKEAALQGKILSQEVAYISIGMLAGFEEALRALEEAGKKKQNPMDMIPRYMPDPVLLAKIKGHNKLIEVGRWV